ncbi:Predicted secreted hydrolase [Delftia tsuruhatensis]|uniref:lipocalin-like domain-containing protein n=1 Tax=Delftia tsuruhatensis TaxID=180282 RepID=UPI001E6AB976|nr:carotenoid 1,2-hydratase [Delftia tsuruhatensis]CAB5657204.1 Predicted secreted hydrolase [Delftia tsuruhatensis]CAC9679142.1 Predicted secreted hydrolase [Delftia tsuruhatensis]
MPMLPRRRLLGLAAAMGAAAAGMPALALPPRALAFARDHGSHPDLRTEWWYITGQARAAGQAWGFQVTFFRSRVDAAQSLRSAFAARQLLFAHAALCDVQAGRLHHDQRIARAGFGLAEAGEADTDVRLQDWSLARSDTDAGERYDTRIRGAGFALELRFETADPPLLQGLAGLSRKGPDPGQASYYYSRPQLRVGGSLELAGRRMEIEAAREPGDNRAWLDHEWSQALMHPDAVGWDWIGMNLFDGRALTAFRLRRADGSALWAGGSLRGADGTVQVFAADVVQFTPLRQWRSPASGASYPVQWQVDTPAGRFTVHALVDAQELDSSASTGAIYWEGLCSLQSRHNPVGQGYLEMTGYARPLQL